MASSAGLADVRTRPDGSAHYQLHVAQGELRLVADFSLDEFRPLLDDRVGVNGGHVFLVAGDGQVLVAPHYVDAEAQPPMPLDAIQECLKGPREWVAPDHRGLDAFQAFSPVSGLGGVCLTAQLDAREALAPAQLLRQELGWRGAVFAALAALVSLMAARWIAAPVRRLAASADKLRHGKFEWGIPVGGPSEVRALGRSLRMMSSDLDRLITKEQTARREAQEAATAKDEFVAVVSHELRTPLNAILGWSEMLRTRPYDQETLSRGLAAIHRSAEAQRRLVDDLLDVSRMVAKQLRVGSDVVDLGSAVTTAVDSLRPQAEEKQVRLELACAQPLIAVRGDAERLQQIVWNLTSNAVKFTPAGGTVRVGLQRVGASARLTVADNGIGISRAVLPQIFDWFKQADSARTRRYTGLGLGLGIVRQLVELHGGDVHAESAGEGQGATFVVTLPAVEAPDAGFVRDSVPVFELPQGGAEMFAQPLHSVRVLLVEDDEETRTMVQEALETAGARVTAVESAPKARQVVQQGVPDVLISDIAMPDEDGYSLIRSLRSSDVHVPAIALTAHARVEDALEATAAGFQVHLAKPVKPSSLVETVAGLAATSA
jgi:signal transduction histidine kinase